MNFIKHKRPDIDKICLYVKDPFESKYKLLINANQNVGTKNLKNPKVFDDYSQTVQHIHENLEDYNQTKERRVLIVFDIMIACRESKKKSNPIVTELFIKERKLSISLVFISQSYCKVHKTIRLNAAQHIMKIANFVTSSHLSDISLKNAIKLNKYHTKEPYAFLVNETTSSSDISLRFRKNLL